MKKVKLSGKLSLNKETIAKLNDEQMAHIKGGRTVQTTCEGQNTCVACEPTDSCTVSEPTCMC